MSNRAIDQSFLFRKTWLRERSLTCQRKSRYLKQTKKEKLLFDAAVRFEHPACKGLHNERSRPIGPLFSFGRWSIAHHFRENQTRPDDCLYD